MLEIELITLDTLKTEVIFRFNVKTTLNHYKSSSYSNVERTYTELEKLSLYLQKNYFELVLPTLPPLPSLDSLKKPELNKICFNYFKTYFWSLSCKKILWKDIELQNFIENEFLYATSVRTTTNQPRFKTGGSWSSSRFKTLSSSSSSSINGVAGSDKDEQFFITLEKSFKGLTPLINRAKNDYLKLIKSEQEYINYSTKLNKNIKNLDLLLTEKKFVNFVTELNANLSQFYTNYDLKTNELAFYQNYYFNFKFLEYSQLQEVIKTRKELVEAHNYSIDLTKKKKQTMIMLKSSTTINEDKVNQALQDYEEVKQYEQYREKQVEKLQNSLPQEFVDWQQQHFDGTMDWVKTYVKLELTKRKEGLDTLRSMLAQTSNPQPQLTSA